MTNARKKVYELIDAMEDKETAAKLRGAINRWESFVFSGMSNAQREHFSSGLGQKLIDLVNSWIMELDLEEAFFYDDETASLLLHIGEGQPLSKYEEYEDIAKALSREHQTRVYGLDRNGYIFCTFDEREEEVLGEEENAE